MRRRELVLLVGAAMATARSQSPRFAGGGRGVSQPITVIAFCWAPRLRAVAIAAPTRSTNSRRLIRLHRPGAASSAVAEYARLEPARTMGNPA